MGHQTSKTDNTHLHYYNTPHFIQKMQIKFLAPLILLIAVANSSPLVQDKDLANAEKEIRAQLTTFFEGENVEDAKQKAKEVSDRIVAIYEDSSKTLTEKAQSIKEAIEEAAGQVSKENLDAAFTKIMAQVTDSYAPYVESLKETLKESLKDNEAVQKGWNFITGLLGDE